MKKTTDLKSLNDSLKNCSKKKLQIILETLCRGSKRTSNIAKIVLGVDVDNAVQSIRREYNNLLGTTGFELGDDCYYDYSDIDEVTSYLTELFQSVFAPLIEFKKHEIVTEYFKELFLISSSMYGSGGPNIEVHLQELLKKYWHRILEAQGSDETLKKDFEAWFKTPEIYNRLEDYGEEEFFDAVINYQENTSVHTNCVTQNPSYIKTFMYLKQDKIFPEKREILVVAENENYVQGIDFKYLTPKQTELCQNELYGKSKISSCVFINEIPSWIEEEYEQLADACRIFRKDRIVYKLEEK